MSKKVMYVTSFILAVMVYLVTGCGQSDSENEPSTPQSQGSMTRQAGSQTKGEWIALFDGTNFDAWRMDKPDGWIIEDNVMSRSAGGSIWSKERFGNFELALDFKVSTDCNSGIFFRTGSLSDPVQTGIEMQVLDSAGKPNPDKHDCGAMYDLLEPSTNAMKSAGEWNHVTITCNDNTIAVVMNGTKVIDMDVDQWTTPNKNPDGTENKFKTALKDFPREGHIGFQDHGHPVWYRTVKLKKL